MDLPGPRICFTFLIALYVVRPASVRGAISSGFKLASLSILITYLYEGTRTNSEYPPSGPNPAHFPLAQICSLPILHCEQTPQPQLLETTTKSPFLTKFSGTESPTS